ncbi:FeoA family protein [Clostridium paraputrificum]|uniref:FeoA family protein n=1 Tax=Clostridium paraputrificum TaxID=29363 RepID=UPI003564A0D2
MTLKELKPGEFGTVKSIGEKGVMRRRLMDMGVTPGVSIKVIKIAPLGDPIEINIRGYALSLRKSDAEQIIVIK